MFSRNTQYYKLIYLTGCLLLIFGFTFGYIYTTGKIKDKEISANFGTFEGTQEMIADSTNESDTQNVVNQSIISEDAIFTTKTYYTVCGHTIIESVTVPSDITTLTEKQFRIAYQDWSIDRYSKDEIIISQVVEDICSEHYIVKEKDGVVAVYYQKPINGVSLKEITNISVSNLSTTDQAKLKEGIVVSSNQQLAELLEDLGS